MRLIAISAKTPAEQLAWGQAVETIKAAIIRGEEIPTGSLMHARQMCIMQWLRAPWWRPLRRRFFGGLARDLNRLIVDQAERQSAEPIDTGSREGRAEILRRLLVHVATRKDES